MNEQDIPEYLRDIYKITQCAFQNGVEDHLYWALLFILTKTMSLRTIADILPKLTGKHWIEIYNDASGVLSDPEPATELIEAVQKRLDSCGYSEWRDNQI